jgi:hypothetical protein
LCPALLTIKFPTNGGFSLTREVVGYAKRRFGRKFDRLTS